jgi:hypothetical protein
VLVVTSQLHVLDGQGQRRADERGKLALTSIIRDMGRMGLVGNIKPCRGNNTCWNGNASMYTGVKTLHCGGVRAGPSLCIHIHVRMCVCTHV